MNFPFLKTAHYTSKKFEGVKEFYIVENKEDLKNLMRMFPALRKSWQVIRERIKDIVSDGYVAIVSDINQTSNCIEVYYENVIPNKYTYADAFHRVEVEVEELTQ
jgi:hypothetical protein